MSKGESDAQLVQGFMVWVKEGIESLSMESFPKLVDVSDNVLSQLKDEAHACADYLWKRAEEVENASTSVVWSIRFLAACSSLVGTVFASSSTDLQVRFWLYLRS